MPMKAKPTQPAAHCSDDSADASAMSDLSASALTSAAALSSESESAHHSWQAAPVAPHAESSGADYEDTRPGTPPCAEENVHDMFPDAASPHRASPPCAPNASSPEHATPEEGEHAALLAAMADAAPPTPRARAADDDDDDDDDGLDEEEEDDDEAHSQPIMPFDQSQSAATPASQSADPDWEPSEEPSEEPSLEPSQGASQETDASPPAAEPAGETGSSDESPPAPAPTPAPPSKRGFKAPRAAAAGAAPAAARPKKKTTITVSSSSEGDATPAEESVPVDVGDETDSAPCATTPATANKPAKGGKKRQHGDASSSSKSGGGKSSGGKSSGGKKSGSKGASSKGSEDMPPSKKLKKDPNAPKGPRSSYLLWSAEARKTEPFASMAFTDAGRAIGAAWKELTVDEKAPWEAKAKEDKKRHAAEMAECASKPILPRARALCCPWMHSVEDRAHARSPRSQVHAASGRLCADHAQEEGERRAQVVHQGVHQGRCQGLVVVCSLHQEAFDAEG